MAHRGFTTIELANWQDFKLYIGNFSENWAFRGQASDVWDLRNAIERTEFIQFYDGIEKEFLSEFQRGARNYLSRDELPQHLIEWLALMQHHGAPTRLLDFTKSPYIAAYFAFEVSSSHQLENVAIWGVNIAYLKEKSVALLAEDFGDALKETDNLINEKLFEKVFMQNNKSLVFPVEPFRMNQRYSLQQSIFVSTGTSSKPLMEQLTFLGEDMGKAVVKMVLPASIKKEALRELQQMNIYRASLFPNLDGYALSLRLRYDSRKTPDEIEKEAHYKNKDHDYPFFP